MRKYLLALFCGLLFPLGFAPFDYWPLTILSISLVIYLVTERVEKNTFLLGLFYGFGQWGLGISWVYVSIHYHANQGILSSVLITSLFIFSLSLFTGLIFYLITKLKISNKKLHYLLFFPVVWVTVEVIRSNIFTGFPWLIVGTSLAGTSMGGWIPILGTYSASILVVMISGGLVLIFRNKKKIHWSPALIIMIILVSSFTLNKINWTKEISIIQASIYQPNLTLKEKWSSEGVRQTMSMINGSISDAQEGEFIFFPETAIIVDKEDLYTWISDIEKEAKSRNISLISGIIAKDLQNPGLIERYNRIEGFGAIKGHYDKIHLVPFGEYTPIASFFPDLIQESGWEAGKSYDVFPIPSTSNLKMGVAICYESSFPNLVRQFVKKGAVMMGILTNDAWFEGTSAPIQHLSMSPFRAVENRVPVFRCANGGISCIIDGFGRVLETQILPENQDGFLINSITLENDKKRTIYTLYGDWFPITCFIISLGLIANLLYQYRNRGRSG